MNKNEYIGETYLLYKEMVEVTYRNHIIHHERYQHDNFEMETTHVIYEMPIADDIDEFYIYLNISLYAIRHKKALPAEVKNKMINFIKNDFFMNNIENFIDDEVEDIMNDFNSIKSYIIQNQQ
jgi:hypothetical protein